MLAWPGGPEAPCAAGFTRAGARCLPGPTCPAPLARGPRGCDAPDDRVDVPATAFSIGPSDWEAEGRIAPRRVEAARFSIDRFEVTSGRACMGAVFAGAAFCDRSDPARAASGVTLDQARAFCR